MLNRLIFPLILIFAIGFLYYFSAITMPFIVATGLAYVFQPLVGHLEKFHFPRWIGALVVTCFMLAAISVFFIYTAPILYEQLTKLIFKIPAYLRQLQEVVQTLFNTLNDRIPAEYSNQIQHAIQSISKDLVAWLFANTQFAFQGGLTLIHYLTIVLLIPVLTFYLMKDWPKLIDSIGYYIPPQNKKVVIQQAKKIDITLASFARGQALVCMILAAYYSIALHILGIDFGALIGSLAGIFAFIPYVGALLGFSISAAIAFLQASPWLFGDSGSIALFGGVTIVFAVGQFLEGVILSPNIVGKSIKLHPLWIMFALFLGGHVFGFAGVLVATPAAGAIAVLLRYALTRYRDKMHFLYHGYARRRGHGSKT